jgi:hypothetical protein
MRIRPILFGLSLAAASSLCVAAQDASTSSIPMVLQITREYTKPYKGGVAHDKTESAFVAAMTKAKFPAYYVGMNSMSGRARSLFFTRYKSFAEWEQDNKLVDKNPALGGEIERAGLADGELLDQVDSVVYTFDQDLSFKPHRDLEHHRFYEISVFHVRPGKRKEWHDVVKMVKEANEKAGTSAHWGMYNLAYGGEDGTYIAVSGDESMADIDKGFEESKKWIAAMGGEEGMGKFDKLFGEAVDTSHTELFAVNPKQSYVNEDWIKDDPAFWKPKAAAAPAKAAASAEKPATH